jgi:hypothetical protein
LIGTFTLKNQIGWTSKQDASMSTPVASSGYLKSVRFVLCFALAKCVPMRKEK